ncbi:MAG: hypothetical protein AAB214_04180 [Fibrobacterota bacterium]
MFRAKTVSVTGLDPGSNETVTDQGAFFNLVLRPPHEITTESIPEAA